MPEARQRRADQPRPPIGRPPGVTAQKLSAIHDALAQGLSERRAADQAGIPRKTYFRWKRLGQQQRSGPYQRFASAIQQGKHAYIEHQERNARAVAKQQKAEATARALDQMVLAQEQQESFLRQLVASLHSEAAS